MTVKKDEQVKPEVTVSVSTKSPAKASKSLEKVATKSTFKIFYGDRWYYFTKGEVVEVTKDLKDYLNSQGALTVL